MNCGAKMGEVLTAAQMRAIEQAAIASGAVTGLELMERAGAGVVAAVLEEWPVLALTSQRAVVLCGPGNNGGDGFVVARLLAGRGWAVEVFLYGDAGKLPPDARVNYERWLELGEVGKFSELLKQHGWDSDLNLCFGGEKVIFVDAVFGTGLSRPLDFELAQFMQDARDRTLGHTVTIDIPSGYCSNSGKALIENIEDAIDLNFSRYFDLCVTFHRAKIGHLLLEGSRASRHVRIVDIGLNTFHWKHLWGWSGGTTRDQDGSLSSIKWISPVTWIGMAGPTNPAFDFEVSTPLSKQGQSHKFSHGHALIVSGDHGHAGAARMAARGALRIGAGLVTVASPLGAMAENAARLDAVMLKPVADAAALAAILADTRINALCLGPGMGLDTRAAEVVRVALETLRLRGEPAAARGLAVVLDADALTLIAEDAGLFALLHKGCVLTPHGGEFARLFPDIAARLAAPATTGPAYSKVDAVRDAAKRAGCVVLYKGADTVIAGPDGRCAINAAVYDRAAPWLATAGSGDVLAGFITGLLARGFSPFDAACTGAWLHVECARDFGPGLIAEDLPEILPKVLRKLGV
jgi:hydroxyethylthiazole kinase-like uncharacterized protein yjeF